VLPFVEQLPAGDDQRGVGLAKGDPRPVEAVSTAIGLVGDVVKVRAHGPAGIGVLPEADQLRMADVAARCSSQNGLSEEAFAPQCDQPGRVQISRVKRPETHRASISCNSNYEHLR
jgi:hypothetical protein